MVITVEPKLSELVTEELWLAEDPEPVGEEYGGLRVTEELG